MCKRQWIWAPKRIRSLPTDKKKDVIVATCDKFVAEVLKPRFLPSIRPTRFNCPADIYGKWHGGIYRFVQRYRSGWPDNRGWEFEEPFARLDYLAGNRFDVMWHRHTGTWWRLYHSVSLAEAIRCIEKDGHLHPLKHFRQIAPITIIGPQSLTLPHFSSNSFWYSSN
jgi:hypothetical protein